MVAHDEWISLSGAMDLGINDEVLPGHAAEKIIAALKSESIRSRATTYSVKGEILLPERLDVILRGWQWTVADQQLTIDIHQNRLTYILSDPQPPADASVGTIREILLNRIVHHCKNIEVVKSHVQKLWSDAQSLQDRAVGPQPKNKGGRPEEHNWPAAFAYCGWWVAENHLPDRKARLVELVIDWFEKEDGGAPRDLDEVRKRVGRAYDELKKLEQHSDGAG